MRSDFVTMPMVTKEQYDKATERYLASPDGVTWNDCLRCVVNGDKCVNKGDNDMNMEHDCGPVYEGEIYVTKSGKNVQIMEWSDKWKAFLGVVLHSGETGHWTVEGGFKSFLDLEEDSEHPMTIVRSLEAVLIDSYLMRCLPMWACWIAKDKYGWWWFSAEPTRLVDGECWDSKDHFFGLIPEDYCKNLPVEVDYAESKTEIVRAAD